MLSCKSDEKLRSNCVTIHANGILQICYLILKKSHTHTLFVLKNIWILASLKYFKRSLFTRIVSNVSRIASWTKYSQNANPSGLKHNCYWRHFWHKMWTINHMHDSFCDELEMTKDSYRLYIRFIKWIWLKSLYMTKWRKCILCTLCHWLHFDSTVIGILYISKFMRLICCHTTYISEIVKQINHIIHKYFSASASLDIRYQQRCSSRHSIFILIPMKWQL